MKTTKITSNLKKVGLTSDIIRLLVIFAGSFIVMTALEPNIFFTKRYMISMASLFPEYGILALAMMLAMISGGIDLSVVATANFAGIIAIKFLINFFPAEGAGLLTEAGFLAAVIAIAVIVGAVCGALVAFLISKVGIPPMLATLGGADLIMGGSLVLTKGSSVNGIPEFFSQVGTKVLFGFLPVPVIIFAVCALLVSYALNRTSYGMKLRMMGSNPTASRFSGINNAAVVFKTYIMGGMLSALSGLLMISRANSARADYGNSYVMQAIIICVLGGTNPNGGFGKVSGVTIAILILQVLSSGFNMFPQISNFYRNIIWGAVLILVVIYNHVSEKRRIRKMAEEAAK
ncbi:MAG: ABC transporter permease [Oscillospiraceae bacterium]|nr:ABC transporter permease [Oscillospiraceae bacterium]